MTAYRLQISQRAEQDADAIYAWLAKRSVQGAVSWVAILRETFQSIVENPQRHPHAVIRGETIHIVAIRGSGQDLAKPDDLQLP